MFLWSDLYLGAIKALWQQKQLFTLTMKFSDQTKLGHMKNR